MMIVWINDGIGIKKLDARKCIAKEGDSVESIQFNPTFLYSTFKTTGLPLQCSTIKNYKHTYMYIYTAHKN